MLVVLRANNENSQPLLYNFEFCKKKSAKMRSFMKFRDVLSVKVKAKLRGHGWIMNWVLGPLGVWFCQY